jgi:hypothetical protein
VRDDDILHRPFRREGIRMSRLRVFCAVLVALAAQPGSAPAWFGSSLPTMRESLADADAVIVGTLKRATPPNPSRSREGVTDFVVDRVIKTHPSLGGQKTITLRQYIPPAGGGPAPFILFGYVNKGKLDYPAGFQVKVKSEVPRYLEGIQKLKGAKPGKHWRFYFDHLEHPEAAIASDAFEEFARYHSRDFRETVTVRALSEEKLRGWIRDPKTPAERVGLYAHMLGHCSTDQVRDGALLRALATKSRPNLHLAHVLTGYVLLQPREGWTCICNTLSNPSKDSSACLRAFWAVQFLRTKRPEIISRRQMIDGVAPLLDDGEFADSAIYELHALKAWELTDRILSLRDQAFHESPHVQRAILYFALRSPKGTAKRFVEELRKRDPEKVREAEERLVLERKPSPK